MNWDWDRVRSRLQSRLSSPWCDCHSTKIMMTFTMLGTSELRRMRENNDYLRTWVSRRGHHRVTDSQVSRVSRDRGKFGDIRQRIVTNNHYFVCHISGAINLIYYYWFEMYSRNKNYKVKFMLQKQFVCKAGENCIVVIRFNSLINPICVGDQACH